MCLYNFDCHDRCSIIIASLDWPYPTKIFHLFEICFKKKNWPNLICVLLKKNVDSIWTLNSKCADQLLSPNWYLFSIGTTTNKHFRISTIAVEFNWLFKSSNCYSDKHSKLLSSIASKFLLAWINLKITPCHIWKAAKVANERRRQNRWFVTFDEIFS